MQLHKLREPRPPSRQNVAHRTGLASQGCWVTRVRANCSSVDLMGNQVVQFEHVNPANNNFLVEFFTRTPIVECALARCNPASSRYWRTVFSGMPSKTGVKPSCREPCRPSPYAFREPVRHSFVMVHPVDSSKSGWAYHQAYKAYPLPERS